MVELIEYYRQLDEKLNAFKNSTKLECPSGCGWCCETADPEITVYEAVPLARMILSDDALLARYEQYVHEGVRKPCFFYDRKKKNCTIYPVRPMICRTFGYAGIRDKNGKAKFAACKRMVNANDYTIEDIDAMPIFQVAQYELFALAPPEIGKLMPFDQAVLEAVHRERLRQQFAQMEAEEERPDDDDNLPPDFLLGGPALDVAEPA